MKVKWAGLIVTILLSVIMVILIGPADVFTHGFYTERINIWEIPGQNYLEEIYLGENDYEMQFSPKKDHLRGFEIVVSKPDTNVAENLVLTVTEEKGQVIDEETINTESLKNLEWYEAKIKGNYKKNKTYNLKISSGNKGQGLNLICVTSDYLPPETTSGNLLINYAYAESTFTPDRKILLVIIVIAIGLLASSFFAGKKAERVLRVFAGVLFVTGVLTWNYMYCILDNQNETFEHFQDDSDVLVIGAIYADKDGVSAPNPHERGFRLGNYNNVRGGLYYYRWWNYISDDNWDEGYSRGKNEIIIASTEYSRSVAQIGNTVEFANGDVGVIEDVRDENNSIIVSFAGDRHLSPRRNGSLDEAVFYDSQGERLPEGSFEVYKSQYGLQGKIFVRLARWIKDENFLTPLCLLSSIAMALTAVLIVFLVSKKYNSILAACFLATFTLSPWIVNFSRNIYWVEFTWFLPMAAGLLCAWKIKERKYRIISYFLAFMTIFIKSLCGYEYISSIMIGLVFAPLVDFFVALVNREKKKVQRLVITILILGASALAGFGMALIMHARLESGGDLIAGIKVIIRDVALRRTYGADLNVEADSIGESLNASIWETVAEYFSFPTQLFTGVSGNLFPILCIIPLLIFAYEFIKKELNIENIFLYAVTFVIGFSWFALGKAHSYIHTHMNYVLWYCGFIQVCLYISVSKLAKSIVAVGRKAK